MPTSVRSSTTRPATCRRERPICSCKTSAICQPTGNTGFSEDIGSWKTTEMSLPRIARSVSIGSASRFRPPKSTLLSGETIAFSGSNLTIDIARHALARSRFADQRNGRVLRDVEAQPAHGLGDVVLAQPERHAQIAHRNKIAHVRSSCTHANASRPGFCCALSCLCDEKNRLAPPAIFSVSNAQK